LFLRLCVRGYRQRKKGAGEGEVLDGILLVDGYNVINNWPELSDLKEHDLSYAREQLVADLAEFQALCGISVIVVFDAHFVKGGVGHSEHYLGVEVVYTREGETADNWIERYAVQHRFASQEEKNLSLFVATYDWLEQRIISAQGAYRVTPQELRQDMQKIKNIEKMRLSSKCERVLLDHHLSESTKKVLEGWRRHKFSDF
jgi:predicted RNA-binding protein with PIN domain